MAEQEKKNLKGKLTLNVGGNAGGAASRKPRMRGIGQTYEVVRKRSVRKTSRPETEQKNRADGAGNLTPAEMAARAAALEKSASVPPPQSPPQSPPPSPPPASQKASPPPPTGDDGRNRAPESDPGAARQAKAPRKPVQEPASAPQSRPPASGRPSSRRREREAATPAPPRKAPPRQRISGEGRRRGKITITEALDGGESMRQRSLASVRRAREREKARMRGSTEAQPKIKQVREVTIPDVITVQELARRMAERGADVIKELMKLGVMATVTQTIDAETAELITLELGHKPSRVSEADVDIIASDSGDDDPALKKPRPPVVTVMGHVDHGKTSILDAIRKADVAAGESGGITQHIGAYQVTTASGAHITFIDTPGHEAFTEMRMRGANITDIVVLVVAADDGVKPQTVEAISHARAADVPIIIAINKCDKPEADPARVKSELLANEVATEDYGGDVLAVEVSAHTGAGLEKLMETILLQAEIMELGANPERVAEGAVIEAKLERGRGSVASLLVICGTLRVGDVFVVGAEMGRVRAMYDDRGNAKQAALPGDAVEVLGLSGTPRAGDRLTVVENESRAREVTDYRQRSRRSREAAAIAVRRGSVEQMMSAIAAGEAEELAVVLKTDVHGSLEAIRVAVEKLATDQVKVRLLSAGVGAISESDVGLASAGGGLVLGFNVRANPQARATARRDGIEIRYHSIIYELIDEVKAAMSGLLPAEHKEEFIGYAEIREVFNISKLGNIAGCMVTEGVIKRGCNVRLLRNDVVVHEGALKTLKHFKDEVREVREGQECGMALESHEDMEVGDRIECFEIREVARTLEG